MGKDLSPSGKTKLESEWQGKGYGDSTETIDSSWKESEEYKGVHSKKELK